MTSSANSAGQASFSDRLRRLLCGRVCLIGVGNRHRRDDGAGSLLAERLEGRSGVISIDAGEVPENYLEKVARTRPDTILIVDAVDFGGAPGELRILEPEALGAAGISTHGLSLRMTADFLKARTLARLAVLAIQPAEVGPGDALSAAVSEAVRVLEAALSAALHDRSGSRGDGGDLAP